MRPIAAIALALVLPASPTLAGPDMECPGGSQIEIGACVHATLERVDAAVGQAYGFARDAAAELDQVTGREVAVPALAAAQAAWSAYRDAECDFAGAMFGGGSGTGIGIEACRVTLGRARVEALLAAAR